MLSPSRSSIAQQLPHQLLNVPLTSGVEKGGPTYSDISNLKVTLYEEASELQSSQSSQHTGAKTVSLLT
jgi:hypothetical protein